MVTSQKTNRWMRKNRFFQQEFGPVLGDRQYKPEVAFQSGKIDPAEPHFPAVYLGYTDRYPMLDEGLVKADAAEYLKGWRRDTDSA
jgi:hypothetical protein